MTEMVFLVLLCAFKRWLVYSTLLVINIELSNLDCLKSTLFQRWRIFGSPGIELLF